MDSKLFSRKMCKNFQTKKSLVSLIVPPQHSSTASHRHTCCVCKSLSKIVFAWSSSQSDFLKEEYTHAQCTTYDEIRWFSDGFFWKICTNLLIYIQIRLISHHYYLCSMMEPPTYLFWILPPMLTQTFFWWVEWSHLGKK